VDLYVKQTIMKEVLDTMFEYRKEKSLAGLEDQYTYMSSVFPFENCEFNEFYNNIKIIREYFY